jgi:hypothetical protein
MAASQQDGDVPPTLLPAYDCMEKVRPGIGRVTGPGHAKAVRPKEASQQAAHTTATGQIDPGLTGLLMSYSYFFIINAG